jgi:hypothetical protein
MSAAMEGVMNASASAAVALNGTMSLAAMVEQEQDIAVREALREATDVRRSFVCARPSICMRLSVQPSALLSRQLRRRVLSVTC